ncbi:uncharacterized protein LOC111042121 isoform X1 [Myzus persicae]|uniref:uncharacterized protein LOC111042121 isoform X1 n=1 Tax=Myzus persicae TaxID=13164 RepID=UPI000B9306C1|nr:uncharacterized protein LOC111042121 isoform X1 [Myzus persicae]
MIVNRSIRLPKMFWLNLSIFIVTTGQWWIYRDTVSAAETEVVAGQDESLFDLGSAANDRSDLRYFQQQVNSLMTVSSVGQPIVRHTLGVVPKPTPWRSRLSGGFFKQPHLNAIDKKAAARRRVTHRPKDAATGRDGVDGVTGDDFTDGGGPKTTTAATAARMLFGTENECVSTNPGRACVCYMTDFLDLICQRLNEAATAGDVDNDDETVALPCPSFKPVPVAFVIYPSTATDGGGTNTASTDAAVVRVEHSADVIIERRNGSKRRGRGRGGGGDEKAVAPAPVWKEIDFDNVVNYRLEKSSDDHYAVQYSLVGGDAKVPCLINGNGTRMNSFKWDFKKSKHKTNSTITGNDTNILLILGLEPGDSNNYTCIPTTDGVENSKNVTSYKHYVVVMSKLSLIDTHFEPDNSRMNMRNFVSCAAGFGIREVFCAACPPHHYSPDKSIECLKCVKGFHQPVAGSEKCVRCRNIFASGCYMKEVSPAVYWFVGFLIVLICSVLVISCACCCREENEKSIKIIPRKIRNKFKKTKRLSMPSSTQMEDTSGNSSVISQSYGKFKNLLKFKKKSKSKIIDSKISFNNVHEKYGQLIQDDHVTKEDNKTN